MNVVKVMGGLGNQFFEYALYRSLEKYGKAGIDISFYGSKDNHTAHFLPREFGLYRFNTVFELADYDLNTTEITEEMYDPNKDYQNCNFWGFWQRAKYIENAKNRKKILEELTLKDEYITDEMKQLAEEMSNCNSVAVHIRRTDYLNFHWQIGVDYYVRAKEEIEKRVDNPRYYLFSDVPDAYKDNLPFRDARVIHLKDFQDFHLMQQAKHNIIANSTFSWWAAYSNKHDNVVVAPEHWISGVAWSPLDLEGWVLV